VARDNVPARPDEPVLEAIDPLAPRLLQTPTADFPLRAPLDVRVALDERPFPLAERVTPGRESELRRDGRALLEACAGLRLRACGAGRLKWARAAAGFELTADLWPLDAPLVNDAGLTEFAATGGTLLAADPLLAAAKWLDDGVCLSVVIWLEAAGGATGCGAVGSGMLSS
jgi:hypothetical protein